MSDLIIDKTNTEWYDFEPFKYVCDSYLSYGWSGTACCGDDSSQNIKEFYNDYNLSGCWAGYLIRDNQRISDAVYHNEADNNLTRFLFYNGYHYCDPVLEGAESIDFDQAYLDDNKELFGFEDDQTITVYDGSTFSINGNNVCEIQGNYYCQDDGYWKYEVDGVDNWNPSMALELKHDAFDETSGCCPEDYCWDGSKCVHPTEYEYNSSKHALNTNPDFTEHIPFSDRDDYSGYRCIFNASGEAEWQNSSIKYDVYLEDSGYCKQDNFCFLDKNFSLTKDSRETLYNENIVFHNDGCCDKNSSGPLLGEVTIDNLEDLNNFGPGIPDCILISGEYKNVTPTACEAMQDCVPDGTIIKKDYIPNIISSFNPSGEYICNNGSWTSKITLTTQEICNWVDGCRAEDFTLVCDKDLILNHGETGENNISEYVNDICVYSKNYDSNSMIAVREEVLIVYLLKDKLYETQDSSNFLNALLNNYNLLYPDQSITLTCDMTSTDDFVECTRNNVEERVFYSNSLNAVIVHNFLEDINFDYTPEGNSFIDWINNLIYRIFHPGFDFGFFELNGNTVYDKIFMTHESNLQVLAAQEYKYDEIASEKTNRTFINYSSEFNLENVITEDHARALFEDDVIRDNSLAGNFIFNRCSDEGYVFIQNPKSKLIIENKISKEDMLWTYLTKTLRLADQNKVDKIYTGELCTRCNSPTHPCNQGMACYEGKCKGLENYSCNFNEECNSSLICLNHNCSKPSCGDRQVFKGTPTYTPNEECDLGDGVNGYLLEQVDPRTLSSGQEFNYCNSSCQYETYKAECNDTYLNADETCEFNLDGSPNLYEENCSTQSYDYGDLHCYAEGTQYECTFNTSSCSLNCGNGKLDDGEECDDGGVVDDCACLSDCSLPFCGDGLVCGHEECDIDHPCNETYTCNGCRCIEIGCEIGCDNDGDNICSYKCGGEDYMDDVPGCAIPVFVTSNKYDGNLGGVSGAHQKCNIVATNEGLQNSSESLFKAWIASSDSNDPESDHNHYNVPYCNMHNEVIATDWNQLTSGDLEVAIKYKEDGSISLDSVWTAVKKEGTYSSNTICDCDAWTDSSRSGWCGDAAAWWYRWTHWFKSPCYHKLPLYCFGGQ